MTSIDRNIPEPPVAKTPSQVDPSDIASVKEMPKTVVDALEKAEAGVKAAMKSVGFPDEPVPPPPTQITASTPKEAAEAIKLFEKVQTIVKMLNKVSEALGNPAMNRGDDTIPPNRKNEIAAGLSQYFGVNFVTAINMAFGDLAKVLSELTKTETENAKTEKELSRDTMNREADAIRNASNLRAEISENKAWMAVGKMATSLVSAAASHINQRLAYNDITNDSTPDQQKAAGLKTEARNASIQSTSSGISSGFDAASEFIGAYYERKVGEQEAQRTIYDKLGRSRDAARESAIKAVNDARDLLTQIHREVPRMTKANYDINMRMNA